MWRSFVLGKISPTVLIFTIYEHVSDERAERYKEEGVGNLEYSISLLIKAIKFTQMF